MKDVRIDIGGEFNVTGNGKPFDGPASRKYRKEWEANGRP